MSPHHGMLDTGQMQCMRTTLYALECPEFLLRDLNLAYDITAYYNYMLLMITCYYNLLVLLHNVYDVTLAHVPILRNCHQAVYI